jgi:hypothetical protein
MIADAQRDITEIERQRDAFARLDRISAVERHLAVLETRFDAAFEGLLKDMERAVSNEDLKQLKRELEDQVKATIASVRTEIAAVRTDIDRSNEQWAERILGGAKALNAESQIQRMEEQKMLGRQIFFTVFGSALSIVAALVVFWMTTARG